MNSSAFKIAGLSLFLSACGSTQTTTNTSQLTLTEEESAALAQDLQQLRFDHFAHPAVKSDFIPPISLPPDRPHQLLVLLVEFADKHFDRFAGSPDQGARLAAYYQDLLFDPQNARPGTLSHYYATQSQGRYALQGKVLEPIQLSRPRAFYGAEHRPQGGDWRNDRDPETMVEEALTLAMQREKNAFDLKEFDRFDPHDFDQDGEHNEPDGYIDHLVLIFAGAGQSSCQALYQLDQKFTPENGLEILGTLNERERECSERLWPHRFVLQRRTGEGPSLSGKLNPLGGVPLQQGAIWARDYNMQAEYTSPSTFTHEFGHSIGLPDIYARVSNNSTGIWDLMSATTDPLPQNLSAWSRMMLGWLKPAVLLPPELGGAREQSFYLASLDDLQPTEDKEISSHAWQAAVIHLPPKKRVITLSDPPEGEWGLYSGQGNDLNRTAQLNLDLKNANAPISLDFMAWWDIEAGWDFTYFETSVDGGRTWKRHRPADLRQMPAQHGHDGHDSLPGFTGISGDLDGDGHNESLPGCAQKPSQDQDSDCEQPVWQKISFDLSELAHQKALVRFKAFTDGAAVNRGFFFDDVRLFVEQKEARHWGFEEGESLADWQLDGFLKSSGEHQMWVPHAYILEYRDIENPDSYDAHLADRNAFRFYADPKSGQLRALRIQPRSGVMVWYYNGTYPWSENEPLNNGFGNGFLLALDAETNDFVLPDFAQWYEGDPAKFNTHYKFDGGQEELKAAFEKTLCFVRPKAYRPADIDCPNDATPLDELSYGDSKLMFNYALLDVLPGDERAKFWPVSELLERQVTQKGTQYRLRNRAWRTAHCFDAPFALKEHAQGLEFFEVKGNELVPVAQAPHRAVAQFDDQNAHINPELKFNAVQLPQSGVSFELVPPGPDAPKNARVQVRMRWRR